MINGEQGQVVTEYAYNVQSEEQSQKLAYYETKTYMVSDCWVFFMDDGSPAEAPGKTFMYAGDEKALLEKRFNRKLWADDSIWFCGMCTFLQFSLMLVAKC